MTVTANEMDPVIVSGPSSGPPTTRMGSLFGRDLLYVVIWSAQLVSAVIVSPVLARVLGPSEFGALATAIALYQVLILIAIIGLDRSITLRFAADGDEAGARRLLGVGILVAGGIGLLAGVTSVWWGSAVGLPDQRDLIVATVLWTAPGAVVVMAMALLMAQDRLRAFAWVSVISAIGGPFLGIALLFGFGRDAPTYAWGGVISQVVAMVIALALTRPLLPRRIDRQRVSDAFRLGAPMMVGGLTVVVLNAGDRIVIQRELGSAEVGRYQVAYTVGYVVILLLASTSQAWTPRIAAVRDEVARRRLIGQSRDELYRLLIPVILGITLGAPTALRIVAPASFDPLSLLPVVFLVALSAFPVAAAGATNRELLISRRTGPLVATGVSAAVLNIVLNVIFVPMFGIVAAAAATFVAFGVQAGLQRLVLPGERPWPRTPGSVKAGVAVACLVAASTMLLPQTPLWNIVRLVGAFACLPWLVVYLRRSRQSGGHRRGNVAL